jgi:DNA-binding beta-propeller fold protein YncE
MLKVLQYGAVFLLLLLVILAMARVQNALYRFYRRIAIGHHPLWEFMAVDEAGRRLLLAHQRNLVVVNMDKDAVIATIPFPGDVYGIAVVPSLQKGFVCHRAAHAVSVFDLQSLAITGRIEGVGQHPEGLLYDACSHRLFACNGTGHQLTVIDPEKEMVVAAIALPGKAAFVAADEKGHVFIPISNSDRVVQADTVTYNIVNQWIPLAGEAPGGIAFDREHNLIFYAFDGRMIVSDAITQQELAVIAIGNHPGSLLYDPSTALLYCANGEGTVSIIRQLEATGYKPEQTLQTQTGSRTLAMDPVTKKLYVAGIKYLSGQKLAPGSFELLVYGM